MSNTTKERAMILHPPATPTTQLSYDPTTQTYVGDISDTHGFGRVYDDACDVGLTLVSVRTGNEIVFVVEHTQHDADGDVTYWDLKPARPSEGHVRSTGRRGLTITVCLFND